MQGAGELRNFYHQNLGEMIQFDYIFFKMDLIDAYCHIDTTNYGYMQDYSCYRIGREFDIVSFKDGFLLSLGKSPEHEQQNLEKL